uniref:Uncharacterized protein n=3 Tax=Aegilops tauschii subsp. strangulata TaxID=200361 RepID=A0A453DQT1_AEGTS
MLAEQFRPGYTAPQQLFHYGSIPMNFRGNWEVARHDLHDSQVITMVPSERDFMDEYDDYFPVRTRSSALCCRTVAIIFLALLVLRHTLPLMVGGDGEYSFALFLLLVLRTAGILFPILVMVRAMATFHRRRRQQVVPSLMISHCWVWNLVRRSDPDNSWQQNTDTSFTYTVEFCVYYFLMRNSGV